MKRTRITAAIALLLLTLGLPAVAGATHQGPGGPPRDFAVGGGTVGDESADPFGVQHIAFAAFGGPTLFSAFTGFAGDPVSGHFRAGGEFVDPEGGDNEIGEFQQEGPVTCLVVQGRQARLVYPNKQARPETNEAFDTVIFLQDNGRSADVPDTVGFAVVPDETPADDPPSEQDDECIAPLQSPVMSPLTNGDITIHDAP